MAHVMVRVAAADDKAQQPASWTARARLCYKVRGPQSMRSAGALRALWAVVLTVTAACGQRLIIGVVLPETGPAAVYGTSLRSGIELAFEATPSGVIGRHRVTVEYRDSGSDPARAVAAAEALYDRGAVVVIGGATTAEARAMIATADRRERVLLSPSASAPELCRLSRYFFRVYPSDELEGVAAADLLAVTLSAPRVVVVEEENDYSRGLLPVFVAELASRGGQMVALIRAGADGFQRDLLTAAREADAVYVCGYGDAILEALRTLRVGSFAGPVCTTSAIGSSALLQRAGQSADGAYLPLATFDPAAGPTGHDFVARYQAEYGLQPDIYAAHGFDAALAARAALERAAQRTGGGLRDALRSLAGVSGVMGELAFDDLGNVQRRLGVYRIRGGRLEQWRRELAAGTAAR
jgi:branched-chain amino acid transport system substrate-binding protein